MRMHARFSSGALVFVSLATAAYGWLAPGIVPDRSEYESVAQLLEGARRPGDALLLVPAWAEGARAYLPEDLPVLSLPPDDLDLQDPERLWVLAHPTLAGATVQDSLEALGRRFGPPRIDRPVGRLRLLRFSPSGPRPSYRLSDHIPEARVTLGGRPCLFRPAGLRSARQQCPGAPWSFVGTQIREIDMLPRRCVWSHPHSRQTLRIELPPLPPGLRLELRAGIVGEMALRTDAAAVTIAVQEGHRPLGALRVEPRPGWQVLALNASSTAPAEGLPLPPLVLEIDTQNDGGRHLCLEFLGFPEPAASPSR